MQQAAAHLEAAAESSSTGGGTGSSGITAQLEAAAESSSTVEAEVTAVSL